jgi:NAD(P)-dependent dehydrogenase (short-subunit alcohol dehydrogenase family)
VAALLARGDSVAVPFRDEGSFESLNRSANAGDRLFGAPVDVAEIDAARSFVEAAAARFGRVDGAALLAGAWAGGFDLEASPAEDWQRMMRSNLDPVQAMARALAPHLSARGGSVVTVGARLVATGGAGAAAYVASKAAVLALTRALAAEGRARGIRWNAVSPGIIDTPANRAAMPGADFSEWTPPDAIAAVIAFLLSPAAAAITGAEIPVDFRG